MRLQTIHLLPPAHSILLLEKQKKDHVPTVAVDLDDTLAKKKKGSKKIGKVIKRIRKKLHKYQKAGFRIIIWTVRGDANEIKDWCHEHDVPFDYVNSNPDQPKDSSQKIIADVYIDDRAVNPDDDDFDEKVDDLIDA